MGREYRRENEAEVQATPEQVWEAIATGPGIDSWFMGRTRVEAGAVTTAFPGFTLNHRIGASERDVRFSYATETAPDGRFEAYEFLIEGRAGSSTVVRAVTSGFLPGDDWAEEFEAMSHGLDLFFATLVAYLGGFAGRTAVPLTVAGEPVTDWAATRTALLAALGLDDPRSGDAVAFTVPGAGRVEGTVYHVSDLTLGIRTGDAMYRFVRGFRGPLLGMHHLFGDVTPTTGTAWRNFLLALPPQ
ncbi:SRPBCC domain-containing protein [Actinocorallia longicatena]|uniref:SRPBCC domain-containing protein n=1 Tax=Actinocorallia longicatena TaxID=111803 RepID=A0ABP6Q9K2_9ACTN